MSHSVEENSLPEPVHKPQTSSGLTQPSYDEVCFLNFPDFETGSATCERCEGGKIKLSVIDWSMRKASQCSFRIIGNLLVSMLIDRTVLSQPLAVNFFVTHF